jgi:hypothetical protein
MGEKMHLLFVFMIFINRSLIKTNNKYNERVWAGWTAKNNVTDQDWRDGYGHYVCLSFGADRAGKKRIVQTSSIYLNLSSCS